MDSIFIIINSGLIPGGQNSCKRQTVFFLPIDPWDKSHKDPEKIDLSVPRRAQYLHNAWKRHQDAVYWVDINLALRKGLKFYHTRSNVIIFQGILPASCIPKVVRLKTGEVFYEKVYMSPRSPPKISLRHDWTRELGSKVVQQPEGKLLDNQKGKLLDKQNYSNQPNQHQIQFVIDQGDLMTCKMKEKRPVLKRSMLVLLTKNSVLQIEQGDLFKTEGKSNTFI